MSKKSFLEEDKEEEEKIRKGLITRVGKSGYEDEIQGHEINPFKDN